MSTPAPIRTRPVALTPARSLALALVVCGMAITAGQVAQAQDGAGSDWSYRVAPYLWGAGLSGEAATLPGAPVAEVDLSFGDILDSLDGAAMLVAQATRGPWGFSLDLQHVATNTEGANPAAGITSAEVDSTTQSLSVHVDYQVHKTDTAEVWVSGGARYWNVETDLRLSNGVDPAFRTSGSDSWWDPLVGVRGNMDVGNGFNIRGWAYLGGFGAGSDMMADVFAGAGYRFSDRTSAVVGWRYQSVDRRSGGFVWDVEQYGPVVGLAFTF